MCNKITEREFNNLIEENGFEETVELLREMIQTEAIKNAIPLGHPHINPLYPLYLIKKMIKVGFKDVKQVAPNECYSDMKFKPFNTTKPEISFYVIAKK